MNVASPHSVLLVEDEPELSLLLKRYLEDEKIRVLACDDLAPGITMAKNQKFSCIVVDYRLKGGTGDLLISGIRKNNSHVNYDTPILLISGFLSGELVKSLGKSINGAMVKPFDRQHFAGKVKALCGSPLPF